MEILPKSDDYEGLANFFSDIASTLENCLEIDNSGLLPDRCKKESAQFQAWRFGQLVTIASSKDYDRRKSLISMANDEIGLRENWGDQKGAKWWSSLRVVASLICEYDPSRDYRIWREQLIDMWRGAHYCSGAPLCEIGPDCDLYWAMRIGFADLILEEINRTQDNPMMIAVSSIGIRQAKLLREFEQLQNQVDILIKRSPPHIDEIKHNLEILVGPIWKILPSDVIDKIAIAEQSYRIGIRNDTAIIDFFAAIESCFYYYFVKYIVGMNLKLEYPPQRLSLGQWAKNFIKASKGEMTNLKTAIERKWLNINWQDICCLADNFDNIQNIRNIYVHSKGVTSSEQQRNNLDKMRNLVIGTGDSSVIKLIVQIFSV